VTEARISLLTPEAARVASGEVGLPAPLAELNVFRLLLRLPKTAKAVSDLLLSMLFGGPLDDRLRELVIMRIGWSTGSEYEWTQHWPIAQQRKCTPDELLALRERTLPESFGPTERAILEATDETLARGVISPETFARCRECIGDDALTELVVAIGCWRLISQLARSIEIPLEDGVAPWPPDGEPGGF